MLNKVRYFLLELLGPMDFIHANAKSSRKTWQNIAKDLLTCFVCVVLFCLNFSLIRIYHDTVNWNTNWRCDNRWNMLWFQHARLNAFVFMCMCFFFLNTFCTPFFSDACHHLHIFYVTFFFDVQFRGEVQSGQKTSTWENGKYVWLKGTSSMYFLVDEELLRFSILFFSLSTLMWPQKRTEKSKRDWDMTNNAF